MSGKCGGSKRKHTPYTSEAQTVAGNIALAVREGKLPKSKLQSASKEMAKGMTLKELKSHSAEAKGKELPKYVKKSASGSGVFTPAEISQGYRKVG